MYRQVNHETPNISPSSSGNRQRHKQTRRIQNPAPYLHVVVLLCVVSNRTNRQVAGLKEHPFDVCMLAQARGPMGENPSLYPVSVLYDRAMLHMH